MPLMQKIQHTKKHVESIAEVPNAPYEKYNKIRNMSIGEVPYAPYGKI